MKDDPFSPEVMDSVAESFKAGDFSQVITAVDGMEVHAGSDMTLHAGWYVYRGLSYYFLQNFAFAIRDYKAALDVDDSWPQAHANLSYIYACCPDDTWHNGELAVHHAFRACELTDWGDWGHILCLAAAYARAGDFSAATSAAERALKLVPDDQRYRVVALMELLDARSPKTADVATDFERLRYLP